MTRSRVITFSDRLILPLQKELSEDTRYDHYLKLADAALAAAREEQDRIKEQIRPHIERYEQITRNKTRIRKGA